MAKGNMKFAFLKINILIQNRMVIFALLSIFFGNEIVVADIAVIAHPSSTIDSVDKRHLMRLYLGKRSSLNGLEVTPMISSLEKCFITR